MLIDSQAREQATDPSRSFIVQAPAGSGKTEILTQRYLRLLSTVQSPEHIIALTFTRKAAHEMRERVVHALEQAQIKTPITSSHQHKTRQYALEALERAHELKWNLIEQPGRLRIITLDSLCQRLTQAIPILEKNISYAQITDKADHLYREASKGCIAFAMNHSDYQAGIKTLLLHMDNRQEQLIQFLSALLTHREQWLAPLFDAKAQNKSDFIKALKFIEQLELSRFTQTLPPILGDELVRCAQALAHIEDNPSSPRAMLKNWEQFSQCDKIMAQALSRLLLTGDGRLRKSFDHHVGLTTTACPAAQYKALKQASKELLQQLEDYPDFLKSLLQISSLPDPDYNEEQWSALNALFDLLPLLVSYLLLVFQEHNEIDFAEIGQQALNALGDAQNPTDLALYLDYTIHHLLIDEFQDTSITQFNLLTRLVSGWEPQDGRTLFLVGDPMQSIYRFRQAEVGLFFRAKEYGIGNVPLHFLQLSANFRSHPALVHWVNQHFISIFPAAVNMELGAVSYHAASPVLEQKPESGVFAIQTSSKECEAERLISLIRQELADYPEQQIAILVRSRTQLSALIRCLRINQIPYQGSDITLLAHLSHLRDVWVLVQALLYPADRLAWLTLLRGPLVGLALEDLHMIASLNPKKSIYLSLASLLEQRALSDEGKIRAQYFYQVMHHALSHRYQQSLSVWVRETLKHFHYHEIIKPEHHEDLEQFWQLLDQHEHLGRLRDRKEFKQELEKLYSRDATPAHLHIMTIHKSKGLEFDTVILPGLGTAPNRGKNSLLRWLYLPIPAQDNLLLMSPIKPAHHENCPVYDYIGQLDAIKDQYEAQRLLYVAVTRAKSRLYLFDYHEQGAKNSFRSLLNKQEFSIDVVEEHMPLTNTYPVRHCLPLAFYKHQEPPHTQNSLHYPHTFTLNTMRTIGVITHRLLQWICDHHPKDIDQVPWKLAQRSLDTQGFDQQLRDEALWIIKDQITRFFQDPLGQWIMSAHEQEKNEYELLVLHQQCPTTRIIDRLFVNQNKLWIIDFKTGKDDDEQQSKYKQQLNDYASHLATIYSLPISCGLYYLMHNRWVSWVYEYENIA